MKTMKIWRIAFMMLAAFSLASCKPSARQTTADAEQPTNTLRNVTKPLNICSDFHLGRHFLGLAMNAFVGILVTLQPNSH